MHQRTETLNYSRTKTLRSSNAHKFSQPQDQPRKYHNDSNFGDESPAKINYRSNTDLIADLTAIGQLGQGDASTYEDQSRIKTAFTNLMAQDLIDDHTLMMMSKSLKNNKLNEAFFKGVASIQGNIDLAFPEKLSAKGSRKSTQQIKPLSHPPKTQSKEFDRMESKEDKKQAGHAGEAPIKSARSHTEGMAGNEAAETVGICKDLMKATVLEPGESTRVWTVDHSTKNLVPGLLEKSGSCKLANSPCNRFLKIICESNQFLLTNDKAMSGIYTSIKDRNDAKTEDSLQNPSLGDINRFVMVGKGSILSDCSYSSFIPETSWVVGLSKNKSIDSSEIKECSTNFKKDAFQSNINWLSDEYFACYASKRVFRYESRDKNPEHDPYKPRYLGCVFGETTMVNAEMDRWNGIVTYYHHYTIKDGSDWLDISTKVEPSVGTVKFATGKRFLDEFALEGNDMKENKLLVFFIKGCSRMVVYGLLSDKEKKGIVVYDTTLSFTDPGAEKTSQKIKFDAPQGENLYQNLFVTGLKVRKRINFPDHLAYDKEGITVKVELADPITTMGNVVPPMTIDTRESRRYLAIFTASHMRAVISTGKETNRFKCFGKDNRLVVGLPKATERHGTIKIWLKKEYQTPESQRNPTYIELFTFCFGFHVTEAHFTQDLSHFWVIFKHESEYQIHQFKLNLPSGPAVFCENLYNESQTYTRFFTDGLMQITVGEHVAILKDRSLPFKPATEEQNAACESGDCRLNSGIFDYSMPEDNLTFRCPLTSIKLPNHRIHSVSATPGFREIYLLYVPVTRELKKQEELMVYKLTYNRPSNSQKDGLIKTDASLVLMLEPTPVYTKVMLDFNVALVGDYIYHPAWDVSGIKEKSPDQKINSSSAESSIVKLHSLEKDRSSLVLPTGSDYRFWMVNNLVVVTYATDTKSKQGGTSSGDEPAYHIAMQEAPGEKQLIEVDQIKEDMKGFELVNTSSSLEDDLLRGDAERPEGGNMKLTPLVFYKRRVGFRIYVVCSDASKKSTNSFGQSYTKFETQVCKWSYLKDITIKPTLSLDGNHVFFVDEKNRMSSIAIDDIVSSSDLAKPEILDLELERPEGVELFAMENYEKIPINRRLEERSNWNDQVDECINPDDNDQSVIPRWVKENEDKRLKLIKTMKLVVIEDRHQEFSMRIKVWSVEEKRLLYTLDVDVPKNMSKDIFSKDAIKSSCLATREAFYLSFLGAIGTEVKTTGGVESKHKDTDKRTFSYHVEYEVSPISSKGKSNMLYYLFDTYINTTNSEEKIPIEEKFMAFTNMIFPYKFSQIASMFSIYYTLNDAEIFSAFLNNINLDSLLYDCRFYELYFQDNQHTESRRLIFEKLQEHFVDLTNVSNTAINPKQAAEFLQCNNSSLMINELSRELFKYLLQCASKDPNIITLQLPDDKMRSIDVHEKYNEDASIRGLTKGLKKNISQGWFTKCCKKSEYSDQADEAINLQKHKEAMLEAEDFNFFNKMNHLKEYFQDEAKDKDFVTYQVHRSLAKIDMANGSTASTNLFLTINKLSDDDIESALLPLIYYKWDSLWYFGLTYSFLYWMMAAVGYIYFGFAIEEPRLAYLLIAMNIIFLIYEAKTAITLGWKEYTNSLWNIADTLLLIFSFGLAIFCIQVDFFDLRAVVALRIVAVTLLWVRAITWLRVVGPLRYLITMVLAVFVDMIAFLVIFAASVIGYTFIWRLSPLLSDYPYSATPDIEGFYNSFYTAVMIILGNVPESESNDEKFGYFRFALNLIGTIILSFAFLNFLIAIISGTYEKINEKRDLSDCKELLNMITEFNAFLENLPFKKKVPSFFFTLHPVVKPNEEMKQLEEKIQILTADMNKKLESMEERLVEEMNTKFDRMDDNIKAMVKQLTIEVRNSNKSRASLEVDNRNSLTAQLSVPS